MTIAKIIRICLGSLLFLTLFQLVACDGSDSAPPVSEPQPQPEPEPEPEPEPDVLSPLHTDGTRWVDADGQPVLLKGVNLGNWLLQEFWMMGQSSDAVNDQCTLEGIFDERFGFAERERLMDLFRDNWIRERDWDLIESFGFNVVRLPFIWNLVEDERNPMTLREDAWQYLDRAIEQAEARGLYVILDLHGAVGAQGWEHHSGCADHNEYWDSAEYQQRTEWLWQQIAGRYAERETVAAYGVLNEPWGTTPENLAAEAIQLHDAIRAVDSDTVVILPGHSQGLDAYPAPADAGMTNVAFEMHFYPGIFGWGEIGYPVHRDWLTCGSDGKGGVCEWDQRLQDLDAPFLVGEFQPWTGLGAQLGADITRATYDTYAGYGWASTAWSYKIVGNSGGQGDGTWGLVTNEQGLGLLAKADTWACPGWDSTLGEACGSSRSAFTPDRDGTHTYYLVIKSGACCDGSLDVTLDNISIIDEDTGHELLLNGGFGDASGWSEWQQSAPPEIDYDYREADGLPTGGEGAALRLHGGGDVNGGLYQAVTLESGRDYRISGRFRDNGSASAWAEIYLVAQQPVDGTDVLAEGPFAPLDFNSASPKEIETLFRAFGDTRYDLHEEVRAALNAETGPTLLDLPDEPANLALTEGSGSATLTWSPGNHPRLAGYRVYRSTTSGNGYSLLADEIAEPLFVDDTVSGDRTYYYVVTAVTDTAESYYSDQVATATVALPLPGRIEAESFNAMSGIQTETTNDTGGGLNIGHVEAGDWLEYTVDVAQAGNYDIRYRLASSGGSEGFTLSAGGESVDTVPVPDTGDWQAWETVGSSIALPAGETTLRIDAQGGAWNLNWFEMTSQ